MKYTNFDFADAEILNFYSKEDSLFIIIKNWQEFNFQFCFPKFCFFHFQIGDFLQKFVEIPPPNERITYYVQKYYEQIPKNHNFRIYKLIDIYDSTRIEIISHTPNVTKMLERA